MIIFWSNVNVHQESHSRGGREVEKMSALWTVASLSPQALEDLVMNQVAKATGMELIH